MGRGRVCAAGAYLIFVAASDENSGEVYHTADARHFVLHDERVHVRPDAGADVEAAQRDAGEPAGGAGRRGVVHSAADAVRDEF